MGDRRKCQTYAASPAEPGGLPVMLAWLRFMRLTRQLQPHVLHGHGAKAAAFVRLKRRAKDTIRVYTPHGGSLHYPPNTVKDAIHSRLERALMNSTDLFVFESVFARDTYRRTIGTPSGLVVCVFNGVTADEFDPVVRAADATDIVYVGEFRYIKGARPSPRCALSPHTTLLRSALHHGAIIAERIR